MHCPRIVTKASDEFQNHALLPTREIGSLFFVLPWCILLVERSCLHCNDRKQNCTIRFKLWSRDHNGTGYKHACAERSVTILKICYGESVDDFLLSLVNHGINSDMQIIITNQSMGHTPEATSPHPSYDTSLWFLRASLHAGPFPIPRILWQVKSVIRNYTTKVCEVFQDINVLTTHLNNLLLHLVSPQKTCTMVVALETIIKLVNNGSRNKTWK